MPLFLFLFYSFLPVALHFNSIFEILRAIDPHLFLCACPPKLPGRSIVELKALFPFLAAGLPNRVLRRAVSSAIIF